MFFGFLFASTPHRTVEENIDVCRALFPLPPLKSEISRDKNRATNWDTVRLIFQYRLFGEPLARFLPLTLTRQKASAMRVRGRGPRHLDSCLAPESPMHYLPINLPTWYSTTTLDRDAIYSGLKSTKAAA